MGKNKLTCEQVMALMSFYVENKLSEQLAKQVKEHLDECFECAESFKNFQQMLGKFLDIESQNETQEVNMEQFNTKQYKNFKQNLSAYLDNELDINENLRIKKIAISNPLARKDLESMFTYKRLLSESFKKTENEIKEDYSKDVLMKLKNGYNIIRIDAFLKLSAIFIFIIFAIMVGSYYILNL